MNKFFPLLLAAVPCCSVAQTVTDVDGNVYPTVTIGEQVWMAANIKATHYADGTLTPNNCFPDGDVTLEESMGRLYTWSAASRNATVEGAQGICPNDWHLPTDAEWMTLIDEAGGDSTAGGHLKSTSSLWSVPNAADNSTGFSAEPAGNCYGCFSCDFVHDFAEFWTSTPIDAQSAANWTMSYLEIMVFRHYNQDKANGFSVRCLSNAPAGVQLLDHPLFSLSPNPSHGSVALELTANAGAATTLMVQDMLGRTVISVPVGNIRRWTIGDLPCGTYLITVADGAQRWHERLVFE